MFKTWTKICLFPVRRLCRPSPSKHFDDADEETGSYHVTRNTQASRNNERPRDKGRTRRSQKCTVRASDLQFTSIRKPGWKATFTLMPRFWRECYWPHAMLTGKYREPCMPKGFDNNPKIKRKPMFPGKVAQLPIPETISRGMGTSRRRNDFCDR